MKINEAIAQARELRSSTAADEMLADWLYDLDGQLAEMFGVPVPVRVWPAEDRELLMPAPHEGIYPLYLAAKIDYFNQETELYINDMTVYNNALAEAQAWYRRKVRPKPACNWRVM